MFLKNLFEKFKKSADDNKSMKNYPACNESKGSFTKELQDHFRIVYSKNSMVTRGVIKGLHCKQRYENYSLKTTYNLHYFPKVYNSDKIFFFNFRFKKASFLAVKKYLKAKEADRKKVFKTLS